MAWSPDGSKIAYRVVSLASHTHDIAVMNATGNVCGDTGCGWTYWRSSYPGADSAPSWSPDGAQLVFNRYAAGLKHVLRVSGPLSTPIELTPGITSFAETPAWSPDGRLIIFALSGLTDDLWTMSELDGSGLTQATPFDFSYMPDWQELNTPASPTPETVTTGSVAIPFASVS